MTLSCLFISGIVNHTQDDGDSVQNIVFTDNCIVINMNQLRHLLWCTVMLFSYTLRMNLCRIALASHVCWKAFPLKWVINILFYMDYLDLTLCHYNDVTWTSCSLKSPFIQRFNSSCRPTSKKHWSSHYWPFVWEFIVDQWIPCTKG